MADVWRRSLTSEDSGRIRAVSPVTLESTFRLISGSLLFPFSRTL